jgi:hypothetical protein
MLRQGQDLRPFEHIAGIAPGHPLHRRVGEQRQPVQTASTRTGHGRITREAKQSPSPVHPWHVSSSRGAVRLEYGAPVELVPIGGEQTALSDGSVEETQLFTQVGDTLLAIRPCEFAHVHPQPGEQETHRMSPRLQPHIDRSWAPRPATEILERRCGIEEDEQSNPLAGDLELPGHLVGHEAPQAHPHEVVRTATLESPYHSNVVGRNLLDAAQRSALPIEAARS